MKINEISNHYYIYCIKQQQKKQDIKPIEPISNINPSLSIPDNAYLEAMQILGSNIDIKI